MDYYFKIKPIRPDLEKNSILIVYQVILKPVVKCGSKYQVTIYA